MSRIASLGMYDAPWLRDANDALWRAIARALRAAGVADAPDALERDAALGAIWLDDRLLLAQTCGYPLVTALDGRVAVVAAPTYALPHCGSARHRSVLVAPASSGVAALSDARGGRLALNGRDSNTGMNLLRHALATIGAQAPFFGAVVETGAHLESLALVAAGGADMAAIDAVTYGLAARERPDLVGGTRVFATTAESPNLPFITRKAASRAEIETLRRALSAALADPEGRAAARALALSGVTPIEREAYSVLTRYAEEAERAGYAELA